MPSTSTVVFRQAGNNLRLGNTLVWVAAAHAWCVRHGFDFYFPAARGILGRLVHAESPLLAMPAALASPWQLDAVAAGGEHFATIDALLVRLLATAREIGPRLGLDERRVSIVPGAVGCIVDTHACAWDSPEVVDFVRAHRVCVVNEPHPFTVGVAPQPEDLARLLGPSPEARALLQGAAAEGGTAIGIHVRQTDYRRWQGGKFFRDDDFYNALASRVLALAPADSRIFIAHDGEFTVAPALAGDPRVAVSSGSVDATVPDFVRFVTCDVLVGPQSTFTTQAMKLGEHWAPRRRAIVHLRPESTVDSLADAIHARLTQEPVRCP